MIFPYEPPLSQYLDYPGVNPKVRNDVGDIRQPWIDLGTELGIGEFAAKALFSLGIMHRYVLSANAVLKEMHHLGFLSAYSLLSSGFEVLGRCTHSSKKVQQDPIGGSGKRLIKGFKFSKRSHLSSGVIVETNHFVQTSGGYDAQELTNMRHLSAHGGCITTALQIKGDIELLHELRKAFYGVPLGETDPHQGKGPIRGAIDRYFEDLASGNKEMCERLATAGISPMPLKLQKGTWPFDTKIVREIKQHIQQNLAQGNFPISGGHTKSDDYFQLYP